MINLDMTMHNTQFIRKYGLYSKIHQVLTYLQLYSLQLCFLLLQAAPNLPRVYNGGPQLSEIIHLTALSPM